MATRTRSAAVRAREVEARKSLREHYRKPKNFETGVNGRPFNKLLANPEKPEEPLHPDNFKGWAHGSMQGYLEAHCKCDPCTDANTRNQQKADENRRRKRAAGDVSEVLDKLTALVPAASPDAVRAAAEVAVASGSAMIRVKGRVPLRTYRADHVKQALRADAPDFVISEAALDTLVSWMTEELSDRVRKAPESSQP